MIATTALSGFRAGHYTLEHLQAGAPPIGLTLLMAWLGGAVLGPTLRPWLPGQSLPVKGAMAGILALVLWPAACLPLHLTPLDVTVALLVIIPLASLLTVYRFKTAAAAADWQKSAPVLMAPIALATGIWIMARFI